MVARSRSRSVHSCSIFFLFFFVSDIHVEPFALKKKGGRMGEREVDKGAAAMSVVIIVARQSEETMMMMNPLATRESLQQTIEDGR